MYSGACIYNGAVDFCEATVRLPGCFPPLTMITNIQAWVAHCLNHIKPISARLNDQTSFMLSAFKPNAVWINCIAGKSQIANKANLQGKIERPNVIHAFSL